MTRSVDSPAQNLDTIQAMQIRMNLQQLFTMDAKTARRFLDRWNAWVQVCDLGPMKRLAKTIMAKAEGILRSIATSQPLKRSIVVKGLIDASVQTRR